MFVSSKIILFLMGTTLISGHVLKSRKPSGSWNPAANLILTSPKLSYLPSPPIKLTDITAGSLPLLSNIWPLKTNLFYKPRIMMAPGKTPISIEVHQKDCDNFEESESFLDDTTFMSKPLEALELKPIPEKPEHKPVLIMVEELSSPSPIMEDKDHTESLVLPQAPELPPLHMPEIYVSTPIEVVTSFEPEKPQIPHISEFKPIEIPKAPELPLFVLPEIPNFIEEVPCQNPEETKPLPELNPIEIPASPEMSDVSNPIEIQLGSAYGSTLIRPEATESKPINIPKAPELPPLVLPELPAPVQVEFIPSHNPTSPNEAEEVEIVSEFRPLASEFPTLCLTEAPFISSFSPMKPTERKETEIDQEFKSYQIPVAPELPPLALPELLTPVEITPEQVEDAPTQEFPLRVNIPAAPELPPLIIPTPIQIYEEGSVSEPKPQNIPAAPQLPFLIIESNSIEPSIPESSQEDIKHSIIPQAPELPPLKITETHLYEVETSPKSPVIDEVLKIPAAPLLKEKPLLVPVENHPLHKPHELSHFVAHEMEPSIAEGLTTGSNEEPCNKDEEIPPTFISQPLLHPIFLAQNIIIERVVPNLYLSHNPKTDRLDSASHSHPVLSNANFESEVY